MAEGVTVHITKYTIFCLFKKYKHFTKLMSIYQMQISKLVSVQRSYVVEYFRRNVRS